MLWIRELMLVRPGFIAPYVACPHMLSLHDKQNQGRFMILLQTIEPHPSFSVERLKATDRLRILTAGRKAGLFEARPVH